MKKTLLKIKHILLLGVLTWTFSCSTDEKLGLEGSNNSAQINSVTQILIIKTQPEYLSKLLLDQLLMEFNQLLMLLF